MKDQTNVRYSALNEWLQKPAVLGFISIVVLAIAYMAVNP